MIATIYTKRQDDTTLFTDLLGQKMELQFNSNPSDAPHPETEILSVFTDVKVTKEMIDSLPSLRLIAVRSTGVDHIDLEMAKARNIAVAHVSGYGATTVAEYTIALMLMASRRMLTVVQESKSDTPDRIAECGIDLYGKTLGILGVGAIGLGVARLATSMGMKVVGYDVYPNEQKAAAAGLTYLSSPDEVIASVDVLSLHMPLADSTRHFMNSERFALLKDGAILLNTARGELVETDELVKALQSGKIWAAGLDVVEESAQSAQLTTMENVIITNHNAYNTVEAIERINRATADNIVHFLDGADFDKVV